MLCRFCNRLDLTQAASHAGLPHHDNYLDLQASAEKGCELCEIIQLKYEEQGRTDDHTNDSGRILCSFNASGSFLYWHNQSQPDKDWLASFYISTDKDDPLASVLFTRPIAPDAASEQLFDTVQDWLLECQQYHPECLRTFSTQLPTRVIDVKGDGQDPVLFLSHNQSGQWIALSHCWGDQVPPLTTSENIEERCTRIIFDDLPPLFQDAIHITRRLGYQYLWIDSLCIMQNSINDWRAESTRMGEIYSEAQLTIAAEACSDSREGLFSKANIHRPRDEIEIDGFVGEDSLHGRVMLDKNPIWSADRCKGPLSTRLWTLQENLLSRRTLLFAEQQIWWQCREMQRSERQPGWYQSSTLEPAFSLVPELGQWDSQNVFPLTSMSSRIKGMNPERQLAYFQPLQCWYRTVNAFCLRKATYRSDTFPALSGIAREYYRHIWQDYKAGLWDGDIHMGLIWSTPHPGVKKDNLYIAPTFSWASLNFSSMNRTFDTSDEIYDHELINYPPTKLKAKIHSLIMKTVISDPFGQVKHGELRLTAPYSVVCSCKIQSAFFDCRPKNDGSTLNYDILRRGYRVKAQDSPECGHCTVEYHNELACVQDGTTTHEDYLYLHVLSHSNANSDKDPHFAFLLILKEIAGATEKYERVGMAILREMGDMATIWPSKTLIIV